MAVSSAASFAEEITRNCSVETSNQIQTEATCGVVVSTPALHQTQCGASV